MSKYGVFSGPYFLVFSPNQFVFSPNTGKYRPEKTPYLDTFTQCKFQLTKKLFADFEQSARTVHRVATQGLLEAQN